MEGNEANQGNLTGRSGNFMPPVAVSAAVREMNAYAGDGILITHALT
jgi:hypothetical protein